MKSTLIDPDALGEAVRLIEEYLAKGGTGFDEERLATAADMLRDLID